jgi:hypothetical protein
VLLTDTLNIQNRRSPHKRNNFLKQHRDRERERENSRHTNAQIKERQKDAAEERVILFSLSFRVRTNFAPASLKSDDGNSNNVFFPAL